MLNGIDAIHVATILDDAVDQLSILGKIMPVTFQGSVNASDIVDDEISQLVKHQLQLEDQYEQISARQGGGLSEELKTSVQLTKEKNDTEVLKNRKAAASDLKSSTYTFGRGLKQSPLTSDNLEKIDSDRAFLTNVIYGTLIEMMETCNFTTLKNAVQSEKEKKIKLQETILKEEEGRKRLRSLQKQFIEVKKEKESEMQQRSEMIAHLKDQLQEMKAKTNMEGKYVKKCTEVGVAQTQKKCSMKESEIVNNIEKLRQKIDEETRVNAEIETYLRSHQNELQQKVEYWSETYEQNVEQKQHELDVLKASKAKDLERLQELTKTFAEYEQVVVQDRIEKEKSKRKAEEAAKELKAAIKLQAWFRGVMVRRGLGPYNKKKKKKGKKGKKGKGKKKK